MTEPSITLQFDFTIGFCCWPIMLSAEGKPQFCGIFFMLVRTRMLGVLLSVRGHMKLHLPYKNTCQNDNCWCLWVKALRYLINIHVRILPSRRLKQPQIASKGLITTTMASNNLLTLKRPQMASNNLKKPLMASNNLKQPPMTSNGL